MFLLFNLPLTLNGFNSCSNSICIFLEWMFSAVGRREMSVNLFQWQICYICPGKLCILERRLPTIFCVRDLPLSKKKIHLIMEYIKLVWKLYMISISYRLSYQAKEVNFRTNDTLITEKQELVISMCISRIINKTAHKLQSKFKILFIIIKL